MAMHPPGDMRISVNPCAPKPNPCPQAAGSVAPILVSIVAMAMGLNLLGVLSFRFPTLDWDVRDLGLPPLVQAFLAGAWTAGC